MWGFSLKALAGADSGAGDANVDRSNAGHADNNQG